MEKNGNMSVLESSWSQNQKNRCEICAYATSRKSQYYRHLETEKHQRKWMETLSETKRVNYDCLLCEKKFKTNSGLWKHKKKCTKNGEQPICEETEDTKSHVEEDINYKEMFMALVKDNKELHKMILELIPKVGNNNNNNNIVNNKQKFNINIFLNEQCKDAKTMNDFINELKVTLEDLQLTQTKGLSEGVTNILTRNMKDLSLYERPMHCTDTKRETVYIKSSGDIIGGKKEPAKWVKDVDNRLLKQAINKTGHVQIKNLDLWKEEHPKCMYDSDEQTEYMILVRNSTADIKEDRRENKVIKKLCGITHVNGEE
jgi:hypothetical protein